MTLRSAVQPLCVLATGTARAESLRLLPAVRADRLRRDGIIMAGSWEPLQFRVRRDGGPGYSPSFEQRAAYEREYSPAMTARLRALVVNFVMVFCYKGFGLSAERESMQDAVRFAGAWREMIVQ